MVRRENKYYQLIPEKIYLNLPAIEEFIRPEIKGYSTDHLKEVVSIVACHIRKDDGTSKLQIKILKELVPQGDKYLKGLIHLGIIQRSGRAIRYVSSYSYGFSPEYHSRYLSLPMQNAKLSLRIHKVQAELRKESTKIIRGRMGQIKYLKQITLDPGYRNFINENYSFGTDQFNCIVASATRIVNGDIFYSVDCTSGRFHSNITNMPKSLRPFLRINGEPLVNLDIKNSQPYLSTILLTNPGKVAGMAKNPAFSLLLRTLKVPQSQDVKKYISLVISGQIYEFLMEEFRKEGLILTRPETKAQVLRILYSRNRMPKNETNRKARLIFKARFPTVHRIFSKIRGSKKGFQRFAILLQSIESHLILDVILPRIFKELPGTIAVTIHDSIMTGKETSKIDAIRKIIYEELTLFVGEPPQIRTEGMVEKGKIYKQYVATTSVTNI